MIDLSIEKLVNYALSKGLIEECDRVWAENTLLSALQLDSFTRPEKVENTELEPILAELIAYGVEHGLLDDSITEKDLFDSRLMGLLTPRPSDVIGKFRSLYAEDPKKATDYYYDLSRATDYIRTYRVVKDLKWKSATEYGELDITVNLSKPEKDPKAIAAAGKAKASGYPKCLLCREAEGYAGRIDYPGRANHRLIPLELNGENFFLQYSPYVYYNEHCIVLNSQHVPMKINKAAFCKLLDFVDLFPHYFLGSNADLPIVGGSILSHDHFQGGHYTFAMAKAEIECELSFPGFADVKAGIVKWPMSVIRLRCADKHHIAELADKILTAWRGYSDPSVTVFAETDGEPHNTITPIARRRDGDFEMDLVLRNNLTTGEYPLGLFHPHQELHHIKKENIGLIEVMGLAVLPARLKAELKELEKLIVEGGDIAASETCAKHAPWVEELRTRYTFTPENTESILRQEVGVVFMKVLEHAGVFKRDEQGRAAFLRFAESVQ
ncbi:MAG: UDP-glucose--hexose-1-phosphate uridylyltransferase [Oscillospiraceae bacterium]|nr:UDP-glucose--hexose-1-phosphate uridylyltransferase [Oscillospiraceae bacterium]